MSEICPKCGAANQIGRSTCISCGAELEIALYAEMFGPPQTLKTRYTIQRPVSRGRSISVFAALDTQNGNRPCLIHQIALTDLDPEDRELVEYRFQDRVVTWQQLQHPNLLSILDADVQHHRLYLVTAPIKGVSLRSIIRDRRQAIAQETLLHWAGQLCDVLDYLHNQNPPRVLGCLSPATIHVDELGHVQIIEVGLVRYKQSGLLGPPKGVPGFAAPEQRDGQITPQSDLFALGRVLYQVMSRQDPRQRPLPSLNKYARGFDSSLLEAVTQSYRTDPAKRYSTASEMRQALQGTLVQDEAQLQSFTLVQGATTQTLSGLLSLCITHWDEGLGALMSGRIEQWLTQSVEGLRAESKDQEADRIDAHLSRTTAARTEGQQKASRPGTTASAQNIALNAAYASWLHDLGALGVQPSVDVSPKRFDFGIIPARIKATTVVHVRNQGQGYLSGRVESRVPWIVVPDPVFGCRAGESISVRIEALGRRLPTGEAQTKQALHVQSNGGATWIEAQASSAQPQLDVPSRRIDFGPITRGASRSRDLTVANTGGGRLGGLVTSRVPWLRVRHPSFSCPAGGSARIAVELLSQELPQGAVRIRRALVVDSDFGQAQIDVAWKWARPILDLDLAGLDLGSVQRGTQVKRSLMLSNRGTAPLVGRIDSHVSWLSVQPPEFQCAPGASQALTIVCDSSSLHGGSTVETDAITIQTNTGTQIVSASIEVLAPKLVLESTSIDLGQVRDGDQAEATLIVGNEGSVPWVGQIRSSVPWLTVEPEHVHCEPGHFVPVTAMLHTNSLDTGGDIASTQAIVVDGMGEHCTIDARFHLVRPNLQLGRTSLDLGLIGRTDVYTVPLKISNAGTGDLEWETNIQGVWLEVIPASGKCGAGTASTIQVKAYALAVENDSDQAWITIQSNGGRIDLPVTVALSSPLLSVEPTYLDLHSENYGHTSDTIRIANRGVGDLEGTVETQVPWLECEPAVFCITTGASAQITVQGKPQEKNEHLHALDAIRVNSNGGTESIEASLSLSLTARLQLSTKDLAIASSGTASFAIANTGFESLHAQVIPEQEWLTVDRREWTIKAGKSVQVHVSTAHAISGTNGVIRILTNTETEQVRVHLESTD